MSSRQVFRGLLGFETCEALDAALRELPSYASPSAVELINGSASPSTPVGLSLARRDDCVLAVDIDASLPSSRWLEMTGALAELGAVAESGHVTMVYQGDGLEVSIAGPQRRERALEHPPRACAWMPLDRAVAHELRREGAPVAEAVFPTVTYARGARGLDVGDWLGILVDLVPDGDRLLALGAPSQRERVDLRAPQDMRVIAELERPGATHLMAFANKELVSVVRVLGTDTIALRGRTIRDALAIDITLHDVSMDPGPHLRADPRVAERRRALRLWLERGVGIVALHER